jgi:hypothetical protein
MKPRCNKTVIFIEIDLQERMIVEHLKNKHFRLRLGQGE